MALFSEPIPRTDQNRIALNHEDWFLIHQDLTKLNDEQDRPMSTAEFTLQANVTETVITTQGVFVKMAGATASNALQDFTHASNALTYTGSTDKKFMFCFHVGRKFTTGTYGNIYGMTPFINGFGIVPNILRLGQIYNPNANIHAESCCGYVNLSTNDVVELYIANVSSTQNFAIADINFIICEINPA